MTETKCFRDAFRDQLYELSGPPNVLRINRNFLFMIRNRLSFDTNCQTPQLLVISQLDVVNGLFHWKSTTKTQGIFKIFFSN